MKKATGMHGASELNGLSFPRCLRNSHRWWLFVFHLTFLSILAISLLPLPLRAQDEYFNHTELNWFTIETPHFFVHYHNGEERSARVVAKVAEDIYGPVTSLYHHEPDQKVSIILKDYDDYSNGASYFYDNKIELWAPPLDFDLRGTHNWFRNVVTHEFTHIVQIQTSMKFGRHVPGVYLQWLGYEAERRQDVLYGYPNVIVSYPVSGFLVPSWFAEGVAQVQSSGVELRLLGLAPRHGSSHVCAGRKYADVERDERIRENKPWKRVFVQCRFLTGEIYL